MFRVASDTDCDGSRLLVRFARDRWLYAYGLKRAHAILAQGTPLIMGVSALFLLRYRISAPDHYVRYRQTMILARMKQTGYDYLALMEG